ncbi:MAG TPA: tRNA lysidine(34) synthetase TilS [Candidatus Sulfotelmatobacter sp.]|nr:tRNA lysidine(34) synthetase TilS [Candidatus Sulfotelmatobacter sp.]
MPLLVERVLAEIQRQELLKPGDRVGMAVSGGIDSVALLRLLLELRADLGIVLFVVHFNHKLRGAESDDDERFVSDLARANGLEFFSDSDVVAEYASREGLSTEAAARELRYGFFRRLLGSEGTPGTESPRRNGAANHSSESSVASEPPTLRRLDKIVTGHTLNDQAETVFMRLIRGTGVNGLSGIHPRIMVENDQGEACGEIVRPLLGIRRHELEQYLIDSRQTWREDSTNANHAFTRNRLRKLALPLLQKEFNPAVVENLAELAEIARGEEEYWENEVAGWMGTAVHWVEPEWVHQSRALVQISLAGNEMTPSYDADLQSKIDSTPWLVANASVSRPWFLSEPVAVQRRVVKAIGEHARIPLEFRHVQQIVRFAAEERNPAKELTLPFGWKLVRHREEFLFVTPDLRETKPPRDYKYELTVPGRAILPEIGIVIEAYRIPADQVAEYNPDELLDADSLPGLLRVRNWHAGDRFWPAHTRSPKKIKELLQERHLTQPERTLWPVVVSGDQIVWVRGFATHAKYGLRPGCRGLLLRDRPWSEGDET